MSRSSFDQRFDTEFEHEARCMLDACDDPDCIFCQPDDGDAAFWDEFLSDPEDTLNDSLEYSFQVVDEESGEEYSFEGLNITPYTMIKAN